MPSTQKPLSNLTRQKMAMGMGSHPVANDLFRTINRLIERVDGLEQGGPVASADEVDPRFAELHAMEDRIAERLTGLEDVMTGIGRRVVALEDTACMVEVPPEAEPAADEPPVDPAEIDHGEGPAPGLQPTKKKRRPHRRT